MIKRLVVLDAEGNRLASLEPVQDSQTAICVESLERAIRGDIDGWLDEVAKRIDFTKVKSIRVEDITVIGSLSCD